MATKTSQGGDSSSNGAKKNSPKSSKKNSSFPSEIESHAPWETWAEKLNQRKSPVSLRKILPGTIKRPMAWSLNREMPEDSVTLISELDLLRKRRHVDEPADWATVVNDWIDRSQRDNASIHFGVECVAWAHGLSKLAPRLSAETWWELFNYLLNTCADALASFTLDTKFSDPDHTVIGQLITAELPLTLAYWFPKIDACHSLIEPARHSIGESLVELLDGEGMINSRFCRRLRSLLSIWTRCLYLDQHVKGSINKEARIQYEWFVRQCLRMRRNNGSFVFEEDSLQKDIQNGLMAAALNIGGDETDRELFDSLRKKPSATNSHLPNPGEHSEWAELAILKSDWSKKAITYALGFASPDLETELSVGDQIILSGIDVPTIKVSGRIVNLKSHWEEVCWESDDDVDYVEVEAKLENGFRIQRQIMLAREDRFLFTADAIIGDVEKPISYQRKLPFTDAIQFAANDETREESISANSHLGQVIPVSLNEWRSVTHAGEYRHGELRQQKTGKNLYSGLFIDLAPNRKKKALTFRQLTVAEKLEIQSTDVAVAYRIQIGEEQWIIYRSLERPANRTFMGQNLTSEFLFARFTDCEADTMIDISL